MKPVRTILTAGIVAGAFDIIDALVFFGLRGIKPMSIPQSIAAGLVGMDAFKGGWPMVALGLLLHFAIAIVMAAVFYGLARLVPIVMRHAAVAGMVYGIGLFLVMTYIVVPHSGFLPGHNRPFPPKLDPVLFNALFAHIVLVGLTIGVVTRRDAAR